MADDAKTIRIFTMPRQFPCGPQSSCCGPIGQSKEQIENLKDAIEKELGRPVEVVSVMNWMEIEKHPYAAGAIRSFGPMALPVIALNDEVVSFGNPTPEEAVQAIREKMKES